uniref:Pentacotripeptide-repeat region of PRORP domain-containing protein n=1 Tax=Opuntia streptacantha TaxID=393608 RepID=A0A7C9A4N9_OPUST
MSFVRRVRVLGSTKKGLCFGSHIPQKLVNSRKSFCGYPSSSNPLIQRLIKEPTSRTKAILDSEENSILKSFDFSWHALIAALSSSSTSKAVQALEWRLEKMLKNDERNPEQYSDLICLCRETRNLQLAIRAFVAMESDGVKPTADVFNSLISVSLSLRSEMTAHSLFEIMERSRDYKPNSKTYNAFISMYSNMGNFNAMQEWASAKTAAGFTADLHTYESLISGSVKAKKFDLAGKYYHEMMSSGIIPNIIILEKMIDGLCEQRQFAYAKEFVLHIIDNDWEISAHVAQRLAGLYSELGKIAEIEELLQTLMESSQNPEVLSQVHCGIISMHARADRLDDMEYSVGRMLKQGIMFRSAEDIKTVICSYFRRAAYDRLELFLEHVKSSHQFTRSIYDLLVAGYRKAGLSERLDTLLKDMRFSGIS